MIDISHLKSLDACAPGVEDFIALLPDGWDGDFSPLAQALCLGEWLCPDGQRHSLQRWLGWARDYDLVVIHPMAGWDLRGANLRDANLGDANLYRANLRDADLRDADLTRAYLTGANLSDANLSRAYLSGADLRDANLGGADLTRADLTGAWEIK